MQNDEWFLQNRKSVLERLAWLRDAPQGTVYDNRSALHRIKIIKESASIVRMYFVDPTSQKNNPTSSGAMSAINLEDPFDLRPTPYNQAMLLSLLWNDSPARVYMIGLAGGRIPMILHHYFLDLKVESTDIDADVLSLAKQFFGFELDERQQVTLEDGREYLRKQPENVLYDFIFVDAFRGIGFSPLHLASFDFYHLCKKHLAPQGVILHNIIASDPLLLRKINTIQAVFKHVYLQLDRTIVVFGTNAPEMQPSEILAKAEVLQNQFPFSFSLVSIAQTLHPLFECRKFLSRFGEDDQIVTDQSLENDLRETLSAEDPIFYNAVRNDPCPCGSGKKYKKCHGT